MIDRIKMMVQRELTLLLILPFVFVQGQEIVQLDQDVYGTLITTRNGRNISAYLGIPYAEPPIGPLRFASPLPRNKRNGVIKADEYGNVCPQLNDDGVVVGDEDCLSLNVFTPKINPENPYPVMVYFHGGSYVRGSSQEAGPEYLLDKDIVLVTVNYRLGALGYLSTDTAAALGNFGLKDQILALKWVRKNILAFGGLSNKVTIFGQDVGAASTILLAISDSSKDLFDQFISQSGTPLAYWTFADVFHDHYEMHAKALGDYVNCPTADSFALVECLRSRDAATLVDSNDIFDKKLLTRYRTWAPTTEPADMVGTVITHLPAELALFKQNWIKDCPAIIGFVMDEGLLFTADFYTNDTVYDSVLSNLDSFIMEVTNIVAKDGHTEQTAEKLKKFYFDSVALTDKEAVTQTLTKLITDSSFTFPIVLTAWMMEDLKSPYYMYKFNYRGSYSKTSDIIGSNDNLGMTHGDDLLYFFPLKNSTTQLSESDEKMIDIMVEFWTSFASTGIPTSQYISDPNVWPPFLQLEKSLQIGDGSDYLAMSLDSPMEDSRFLIWQHVTMSEFVNNLADGW